MKLRARTKTSDTWLADFDEWLYKTHMEVSGAQIETYALLDKRSQISLIHECVANALKLRTNPRKKIQEGPSLRSRDVSLKNLSLDGKTIFDVDQANTVPHGCTCVMC